MGGLMSSPMTAMAEQQKGMLERQIQMQNYMRERQMAMMIAQQRELFFNWYSPFYAVLMLGCTAGLIKKRNPALIGPMVPFTFIWGYQYDMAVGNKMDRIRAEADRILEEESSLFTLPGPGLPTVQVLDDRRAAMKK